MKPLVLALDVDTEKEALSLIKATKEHIDLYKIGPTLVLRYGPSIVKKIHKFRKKIFLDLKFHDIPNTMLRSIKEAAALGVYSATVHTSAGEEALQTISREKKRPQIWGVTVLTSLSTTDLEKLGFHNSPLDQVTRFARLAQFGGLDGVVASVGETSALREVLGPKMAIITPGIRLPSNDYGDQKRVATPAHARAAGATYFVVGRPILESKNPAQMAQEMLRDWKRGEIS